MEDFATRQLGAFEGFGPSVISKVARQVTDDASIGHRVPEDRMDARAMLHDRCPVTPGIYGWLDKNNQLCYVGKSKALRKRLLSYFAKTPSDPKMGRIVRHSQRLVWEPVSHELLALIREQELIYRWRPDFNKQGQPNRRQPTFICIGGKSAPRAFTTNKLTNKPTNSNGLVIGPIAGTRRAREAVQCINQAFGLRDCPDQTGFHFSNQKQLFGNAYTPGCIRHELGSCPAPCAAKCSQSDYAANVDLAKAYLRLEDLSVLDRLQDEMQAAGEKLHFEKAAMLRDRLDHLSWLSLRLATLYQAQQDLNGVIVLPGTNRQRVWMVVKSGRLVRSMGQPQSPSAAKSVEEKLAKAATQTERLAENLMDMNIQLMISAWFRKDADFRKRLLSFDQARRLCRSKIKAGSLTSRTLLP